MQCVRVCVAIEAESVHIFFTSLQIVYNHKFAQRWREYAYALPYMHA